MATFQPRVHARPKDSVFTDAQWNTLFHIYDAIIGRLTLEETEELRRYYKSVAVNAVDDATLEAFAQESASDCKEFVDVIYNLFNNDVPQDKLKELQMILNVLDTRPGALLMTGHGTPLSQLPQKDVEAILQSWASARTPVFRKLHKALTTLTKFLYQRSSNIAHKAIKFPGYPFSPESDADLKEKIASATSEPLFTFEDLDAIGVKHEAEKSPKQSEQPLELSTSILIVGSGSGGGVVASHLAAALPHHKVMVVEKGFWYEKDKLPRSERDGMEKMYEKKSFGQSDDGCIGILAGSTWGGGSTINWSVSWQLPAGVRAEWADKYGLKFAKTRDFQNCLDHVTDTMAVNTFPEHYHNSTNSATLKGSHLMGYRNLSLPQNIRDPVKHGKVCGHYCSYGCRGSGDPNLPGGGGKQGTARTFLLNAKEHGAKFVQGFEVDKVLFDKEGKAYAVKGWWKKSEEQKKGIPVIIKADKIIISAGTLNTPAILIRSGVQNRNLGMNLRLHPAVCVTATWPYETKPYEGGILTSVNSEFDSNSGDGYGTRIEGMLMTPALGLHWVQWQSALSWKKQALLYNQMSSHVLVNREKGSGRVTVDKATNGWKVDYIPSAIDRKSLIDAVVGTCRTMRAAGAIGVQGPAIGSPIYRKDPSLSDEEESEAFENFIIELQKHEMPAMGQFGSAHQMGSCRMGTPNLGVVDESGKIYGKHGIYVADGSLFPTASGVNPMITIMALAEWISRGIVKEIRQKEASARL